MTNDRFKLLLDSVNDFITSNLHNQYIYSDWSELKKNIENNHNEVEILKTEKSDLNDHIDELEHQIQNLEIDIELLTECDDKKEKILEEIQDSLNEFLYN